MSELERDLFPALQPEVLPRTPVRPLGPLSDYVVDGIQQDLASIRPAFHRSEFMTDMLSERAEELLVQSGLHLAEVEASGDSNFQDIALLDLLMLNTAIVQSKGAPPEALTQVIERHAGAAGRIPWITYEDLVLVNPLDLDPRLLLDGARGQTELDFYITHAKIEEHLDNIIDTMMSAQQFLRTYSDPEETAQILRDGVLPEDKDPIIRLMIDVGHKLHKPTFDTFNPYFFSTPDFKGPSGAFSAGIPVIEIVLAGDRMPDDRLFYNSEFRNYFPREGVALMDEGMQSAQEGHSLIQGYLRTGENPNLRAELVAIDRFLQEFRGHHAVAVRNKAPETLTGERPGTAGTIQTEKFLLDRARYRYI